MSTNPQKTSKFLSYVLRHRPDEIGLALDSNGWALISDLIERSKAASVTLTEALIVEIVRNGSLRLWLRIGCGSIGRNRRNRRCVVFALLA